MTNLLHDSWLGVPDQREGVWLRATEGENVLLDPSGDHLYVLNESALAIWQLCDGQTTPEEMVQAICALCNGVAAMIAEDVERTLTSLTEAGLIDWVDRHAT